MKYWLNIISLTLCLSYSMVFNLRAYAAQEKVQIDPKQSSVEWTGRKVTGSHTGTVGLTSGEVELVDGLLSAGTFNIDIGQVVVKDIEDPAYNKKLVGHLKSPDFFSITEFPLVTFKITKAEKLKQLGNNGENMDVTGELTIKGLTHPVSFPAHVSVENGTAEASGVVTIDRTKWNIQYGSGKFFQGLGDKLIYDDFEVRFSVKGKVA